MDDHDAAPLPAGDPEPLLHLGRFAAPLADRVAALLSHRRIRFAVDVVERAPDDEPPDRDTAEEGRPPVDLRVDPEWRDDLAAELFANWAELLRGLPAEDAPDVWPRHGSHPGWHDAPADAWIDEYGRLQVETSADEVRAIGPGIAVAGLALALLGVAADTIPTGFGVTFGLLAIVLGLLLPH